MKPCQQCGTDLPAPSGPGRPPAYCGEECRKAARRKRQRPEPPAPAGSRREGFAFRITTPDGRTIEGRWRPRYLEDARERLGYLDRADPYAPIEDLAGLATFEGSRHGGGIRAVRLQDDAARRWAIEERGEDIGAAL